MTHGVTLDWLELPGALETARLPMPPSTTDFLQVAQLANLLTSLFWGTNDFYESPENRLAAARSNRGLRMDYLVARLADDADDPGRIVGFGFLGLGQEPGDRTAEVWVGVHPHARRRGVGSALLRELEAEARRRGRSTLQSWTDNARVVPGQGPDVGYPALRSDAPDAAFAAAHGYALAQLEWCSVLDLGRVAVPAPDRHPDYDLLGWEGACPAEFADSMAELLGRMTAEAPSGDLEVVPETWDVERLRDEERTREGIGLVMVTTAAVQRSSGRLVGHSDIETFQDLEQAAYQANALVHPDHRGRGLALALKAANVARLLGARPGIERLYAWTADENPAILRANAALGFVPVATHPGWQKRS